jgi:hypothetical protein
MEKEITRFILKVEIDGIMYRGYEREYKKEYVVDCNNHEFRFGSKAKIDNIEYTIASVEFLGKGLSIIEVKTILDKER